MPLEDDSDQRRAANQLFDHGVPITVIAKHLGIDSTVLFRWRNDYLRDPGRESHPEQFTNVEVRELRQLTVELRWQLSDAHSRIRRLETQLLLAMGANKKLQKQFGSDNPAS